MPSSRHDRPVDKEEAHRIDEGPGRVGRVRCFPDGGARLEAMLVSASGQEVRATIHLLMESWLSGQEGGLPPAELVESLVALHAYVGLRSSISPRDFELFH